MIQNLRAFKMETVSSYNQVHDKCRKGLETDFKTDQQFWRKKQYFIRPC